MAETGGHPEDIAKEQGLLQVSDPESLRAQVRSVMQEHVKAVEEYRAGKEASLQFLLGASMKATKGAGNPAVLRELLVEELKGS
jgi:aspartyl-tRNA(Asn)/glutamyl-tRNA(Gln) amidotransferase subunit B